MLSTVGEAMRLLLIPLLIAVVVVTAIAVLATPPDELDDEAMRRPDGKVPGGKG
jgi:hypothetical protein